MVSTRSGRSIKHDAPAPEKAAPAKKQKVSEDKAKSIEENGKLNGHHEEKDGEEKQVEEKKIEEEKVEEDKGEAPKVEEKKEESVANGKPDANDVEMKNGTEEKKAEEPQKETPVVNDTEKKDEPVPKPSVEGSEATKAEEQTTGGAPRDTQQAGYPHPPPVPNVLAPRASKRACSTSFSAPASTWSKYPPSPTSKNPTFSSALPKRIPPRPPRQSALFRFRKRRCPRRGRMSGSWRL
jgi:hypothetical protein